MESRGTDSQGWGKARALNSKASTLMEAAMDAPLKGIRVIDWTIWQQGPVATTMLADMGAEVIKIEERDKGDPGRGVFAIGGADNTHNFYFEANNRHKQSFTLDLSKPGAREIVYRLVAK